MDLLREGLAPFVAREVQTAVRAGSVRVDAIRRFAEDRKLASSGASERIGS